MNIFAFEGSHSNNFKHCACILLLLLLPFLKDFSTPFNVVLCCFQSGSESRLVSSSFLFGPFLLLGKVLKTLCSNLLICSLQGTGMSFKYFDIPMFALNDEAEVDDLLEV